MQSKWTFGRMAAATVTAAALAGCYVIPAAPDGRPAYTVDRDGRLQAHSAPALPIPSTAAAAAPPKPLPVTMVARLYPANDIAARSGIVTGTVTNRMDGKGEFRFELGGELLSGEATQISSDGRRGVANGYGSQGTYLGCVYQLSAPTRGTGECRLSNGATYQLHLGQAL